MKSTFIFTLLLLAHWTTASNLSVSQPMFYMEGEEAYALLNIQWDNSWNSNTNRDAVWLFFKSIANRGGYEHIDVRKDGHEVVSVFSQGAEITIEVPHDQKGLFIHTNNTYRGGIEAILKIRFEKSSFLDVDPVNWLLTAYGIEMVQIPSGAFVLGDPDTSALAYGSFYLPGNNGEFGGLVLLSSEDKELVVASDGDIYYRAANPSYQGDQSGTIPATFPKGVTAFYIMKYELTEGQYVRFLNSLDSVQLSNRIIHFETGYGEQGGTIAIDNGHFVTTASDKPCLFVGWDDAMAYADWAGLRPMTEFEFTKAARGISKPIGMEFPWGTNDKLHVQRYPTNDRDLAMRNGWNESRLDHETKPYFGASYYFVMDLSGSLWERVITIGHPDGRSFTGLSGDGVLSEKGEANTPSWPSGQNGEGGIGFRGGGFYGYDREYHIFNPFSPIAYRRYGGWHGPMRNNAYGTRFVRNLIARTK